MSPFLASENASYPPIDDYALIGDCRSAGLISREGSLDWLCFPRFDSPSVFAALLDAREGGRFRIRPLGEFRSERRYLPETNVLETTFRCPGGAFVVRDLMSVSSEEDKRASLTPEHEVLREIEGIGGEVEVEILYDPRPDYGLRRPVLERQWDHGLRCDVGSSPLAPVGFTKGWPAPPASR
jgi:GH15 family glucan-1,4-alpha-glucosidase